MLLEKLKVLQIPVPYKKLKQKIDVKNRYYI